MFKYHIVRTWNQHVLHSSLDDVANTESSDDGILETNQPFNQVYCASFISALIKRWPSATWPARSPNTVASTETEKSSFWWNVHHWLHWKLSKWQLPVQPVMKISSKWRHFCFSVGTSAISYGYHIQTRWTFLSTPGKLVLACVQEIFVFMMCWFEIIFSSSCAR